MIKNIGSADRIIRVLIALVIGALYFAGQITGMMAIILIAVAIIFLLTSLIGTCPLYMLFGISSRSNKHISGLKNE